MSHIQGGTMFEVTLIDDDARIAVREGDYVVFDPTGRDLPDCMVVGRVSGVDPDPDQGGVVVRENGDEDERWAVTRVKCVLAR
jgi:hypothetical protein